MITLTEQIFEKVQLMDEVLEEIGVPMLLNNSYFNVDEMSTGSWLRVNLDEIHENKIPLSLTFTTVAIEARLDRVSEALGWSNDDIWESRPAVKSILKNLFTNYALVEYYGSTRTRITLFDRYGHGTNHFRYYEGISFSMKRSMRLYFPIFHGGGE